MTAGVHKPAIPFGDTFCRAGTMAFSQKLRLVKSGFKTTGHSEEHEIVSLWAHGTLMTDVIVKTTGVPGAATLTKYCQDVVVPLMAAWPSIV